MYLPNAKNHINCKKLINKRTLMYFKQTQSASKTTRIDNFLYGYVFCE